MRSRPALTVLAITLLATACGTTADDPSDPNEDAPEVSSDDFPVTVTNCDIEVTFEQPPERLLVLGRAEVVAILEALDATDRIVARAGAFPDAYYEQDTIDTLAEVPSLGEDLDESGHLQISQEAILEVEPDLVIGEPDGIDRGGLESAGIPLLEQPANCPGGLDVDGFDVIFDEVELYGEVLGVPDRAAQVVEDLEDRIEAVVDAAEGIGEGRAAAALYPTIGGGTTYAYGNQSMPHLLLETAGFTHVFADVDERVFEVTSEEVISRDPEVVVLLHVDGEPGPVEQALRDLPGAGGIRAVQDDEVLVQLFNFGEYPTPLLIDGLEELVETFGDGT